MRSRTARLRIVGLSLVLGLAAMACGRYGPPQRRTPRPTPAASAPAEPPESGSSEEEEGRRTLGSPP